MNITTVDIPKLARTGGGRTAEPNPFDDVVRDLAPGTTARQVETANTDKAINRVKRQLALAGKAHDVTVRSAVEATAKGDKAVVTFWTRPRIVRVVETTNAS